MNLATYMVEDVHYEGSKVEWPAWLPLKGTALSTIPRDWMGRENFIPYDEPIRRVLIRARDSNGWPLLPDWFRGAYFFGADLRPMQGKLSAPGEGSVVITLTADDLQVKLDGWASPKPLNDLSDAEIQRVEGRHLTLAMQKLMGDAKPLPSNLKDLVPGDYRMYQILSCSESKILGGVFKALGQAVPALVPLLRGSSAARIDGLTGSLFIYSDMNPCNVSCDRRLAELVERLPDMNIRVFYRFEDSLERNAWITDGKAKRVIEKNRADWERMYDSRPNPAPGENIETWMKAQAMQEMKKAEVIRWLEHNLLEHPLDMPAHKLWESEDGL